MMRNRDAYNRICEKWDKYRKQNEMNRCVIECSRDIEPNGHILDVGCGTGYPIASYLVKQGFYVTGIDISEKMIEKANALHLENSEFIISDIMNYETDDCFDAIIAFDSLFHLPLENQKIIYQKLSDLLVDDGYLLFTHGKEYGEITGEMFGETFYYSSLDASETLTLLQDSGFIVISWVENYHESTTGDRDLLVMAQKI